MATARQVAVGSALPLSARSPTSSYAMAPDVARYVDSPTMTVPGSATDCRRAAVFTRSPTTMP